MALLRGCPGMIRVLLTKLTLRHRIKLSFDTLHKIRILPLDQKFEDFLMFEDINEYADMTVSVSR